MCLFNISGQKVATEDMVVYKGVRQSEVFPQELSGKPFKGVINDISVEGKVYCGELGELYFCTNNIRLNGKSCDEKFGYLYSWIRDTCVDEVNTFIDGISVSDIKKFNAYKTPFMGFIVEEGKEYTSDLEVAIDGAYVDIGLHSFRDANSVSELPVPYIAECVIPKGSKYYVGLFEGRVSYASDRIIYKSIRKLHE